MSGPAPWPSGIRQTMSNLHIWAGLLAGWLLYAMFLTGTLSYFRQEITQWMRPDAPPLAQAPDVAEAARRTVAQLAGQRATGEQWHIVLPQERSPTVRAFWGDGNGHFDPLTGQPLQLRDTRGGDFFYIFHFQFHYLPRLAGRVLAGLAAMFMLVAIVSGVITHKKFFADFFTLRRGKGQRSWLDAHNALAVFGLPFHLMITYTGLVTLMTLYLPWGSGLVFKTPTERQTLVAEIAALVPLAPAAGQPAAQADVAPMVRAAQARWGPAGVAQLIVQHPGDAASRVVVVRSDAGRVSYNPHYLLFQGASGELLRVKDGAPPVARTHGLLYALHLGRFSDATTRWLYFLVSLAGTAMVGTGLVLWTVKRRARLPDPRRPHLGFRLVERLNIASIAGLSIAIAAFFWANRCLPPALAGRAEWEVHAFFLAWAAALLHAVARSPARAWREQLWLAAALLALLPAVSAWAGGQGLVTSLRAGDWAVACVDLAMLAFAGLHAVLATRVGRGASRPVKDAPEPAVRA